MALAVPELDSWKRLAAVSAGAVLLGAAMLRLTGLIALLIPAVLAVLILAGLVRGLIGWPETEARRRIMWWTMVSFAAHLAFGLAATLISTEIRFYLGADSFTYDAVARAIVRHWNSGIPFPFVPNGKEGFYYMLAGLYWVFGSYASAGLAVNAMLAAGLVPVLSDATFRLFGGRAARYVAPLVVVLPGLFLWTSQLMRESGMLLLLAVALNAAVRLTERVSPAPLTVLISALLLAFTFRAWVALVVAAGLIVGLAVGHRQLISGLSTGLSTLVIAGAVMVASGLGYSGYQAAVDVDLEQANIVRRDLAYSAATGYEPDVDISTTRSALAYLPRGVVNFTAGPFPWQIDSARQLPFVPDMIMWWLLLPVVWEGYRAAGRLVGRRRLIMVIPAIGITLYMSLALGNFGTVVRERLQVIVFLVPLIGLGLTQRASRGEVDMPSVDDDPERIVARRA